MKYAQTGWHMLAGIMHDLHTKKKESRISNTQKKRELRRRLATEHNPHEKERPGSSHLREAGYEPSQSRNSDHDSVMPGSSIALHVSAGYEHYRECEIR